LRRGRLHTLRVLFDDGTEPAIDSRPVLGVLCMVPYRTRRGSAMWRSTRRPIPGSGRMGRTSIPRPSEDLKPWALWWTASWVRAR